MQVTQGTTGTAQTRTLALKLSALRGDCIGCRDCTGHCRALAEALMLPEVLLYRRDG